MKPSEVLRAARKLIETPDLLCRGTYSVKNGVSKFCAYGAVQEACVLTEHYWQDVGKWLLRASMKMHEVGPIDVNDRLGHEAVMQMYSRAISLAEAEGQ